MEEIKKDPILSSKVGTNADLFPSILALYAKEGDSILDLTFGRGVFWRKVDQSKYLVVKNDQFRDEEGIDFHFDARSTGFENESFEMVIFDPPYMPSTGTIMKGIQDCYRNNDSTSFKNQKEVLSFYLEGIREARRLLKPKGILAIKCKDMTAAGKEGWIHPILMDQEGFRCEDLFILVWTGNQLFDPKWKNQKHSRKNNSFFIILRKLGRASRVQPRDKTLEEEFAELLAKPFLPKEPYAYNGIEDPNMEKRMEE